MARSKGQLKKAAAKKRAEEHALNRKNKELKKLYAKFNVGKKRAVKSKPVKSMHVDVPYRRETKEYPSYDSFKGSTARKESQTYTGSYIIGIATMHKSNLVPITSKDAAKDAATRRRN